MKNTKNEKILAHILMIVLVIIWGFDYVPAKWALELLTPECVMFFKFGIGLVFVLMIKLITGKKYHIRAKDIPIFVACAIVGQIGYFECEYNAMSYMPVALITIVLAFLPVVSIILERIIYKRKANRKIYIGIIICLVGIVLVVGADFSIITQGRGIGYLLAVGAVFAWNVYNFITAGLEHYDSITLSITQLLCSSIMLTPFAIHSMPASSEFSPLVIFGILWIGLVDSGIGYLILVYGLKKLGPTTNSVYSNFLPVSTAIFGMLFLGESITILQCIGGAIVIAAGVVVIREKGRIDEERLGNGCADDSKVLELI